MPRSLWGFEQREGVGDGEGSWGRRAGGRGLQEVEGTCGYKELKNINYTCLVLFITLVLGLIEPEVFPGVTGFRDATGRSADGLDGLARALDTQAVRAWGARLEAKAD